MLQILILTERPTVPRPKMTTVDPSDISATFQAAPRPDNRSPVIRQTQTIFHNITKIE